MAKKIETRISNKHDFEINWVQAKGFVPLDGELIIYDKETDENENILTTKKGQDMVPVVPLSEENGGRTTPIQFFRMKIGDGRNTVNNLPFFGEQLQEYVTALEAKVTHNETLINTYILNIDYNTLLAFDTSEIVTGATSTTSVLGQAILGQMVLA